jgi:hypothetical protein
MFSFENAYLQIILGFVKPLLIFFNFDPLKITVTMVEEETAKSIQGWIETADRVAILTHTNPDGDAIGSSLALALALGKMGIDAQVVIPDGLPDFLRWLPGIERSTTFAYKRERAIEIIENADPILMIQSASMGWRNFFRSQMLRKS